MDAISSNPNLFLEYLDYYKKCLLWFWIYLEKPIKIVSIVNNKMYERYNKYVFISGTQVYAWKEFELTGSYLRCMLTVY